MQLRSPQNIFIHHCIVISIFNLANMECPWSVITKIFFVCAFLKKCMLCPNEKVCCNVANSSLQTKIWSLQHLWIIDVFFKKIFIDFFAERSGNAGGMRTHLAGELCVSQPLLLSSGFPLTDVNIDSTYLYYTEIIPLQTQKENADNRQGSSVKATESSSFTNADKSQRGCLLPGVKALG